MLTAALTLIVAILIYKTIAIQIEKRAAKCQHIDFSPTEFIALKWMHLLFLFDKTKTDPPQRYS